MRLKGTIVAFAFAALLSTTAVRAQGCAAVQAQAEVRRAQQTVQLATEQRALWTTAEEALAQAQAALDRGDYAAAVRAARVALEQAELGIAQTSSPRFP